MRTAQVTENTKGAIENKISRSIPSECLLLKLVQDFLGVSVRNQKELILIGIQTIRFEKEKNWQLISAYHSSKQSILQNSKPLTRDLSRITNNNVVLRGLNNLIMTYTKEQFLGLYNA